MQYKLIIPEKLGKINNKMTNLFPKEDFDSSLNPKRKLKVRVGEGAQFWKMIQYIMYEKEIINTSKI